MSSSNPDTQSGAFLTSRTVGLEARERQLLTTTTAVFDAEPHVTEPL